MKKLVSFAMLAAACAASAQVTTNVYSAYDASGLKLYNDTGSDITWSGPLQQTIFTSVIQFATYWGWYWEPLGHIQGDGLYPVPFVTDSNTFLNVATAGVYNFNLESSDGSYLFIDGNLTVSDGGLHGQQWAYGSTFLAAGHHTLEVKFYNDFGGPSGVDTWLPLGLEVSAVPEPAPLAALGLGALILIRRRRK